MAVKFLQTSDWHLGMKLTSLPDDIAEARRRTALESIRQMLHLALDEDIQLVFLPGDLLDNATPSNTLKKNLLGILRYIPSSVKTFITPGTHDFYSEDSFWNDQIFSSYRIFKSNGFSSYDIENTNITIYGVPVLSSGRDKNWFKLAPQLDDNRANILLYHGDYRGTGREYEKWDYPFELNDLINSPFDYVALGHHHKSNQIKSYDKTLAAYSGSPCGWSFRKSELGERNFIIGTIADREINIELKTVPGPLMHDFTLDLSNPIVAENQMELINNTDPNDFMRIQIDSIEDPMGLRRRVSSLTSDFKRLIINEKPGVQTDDISIENVHLKMLIQRLDQYLESGDIDSDYHERLVKRAKRLFLL